MRFEDGDPLICRGIDRLPQGILSTQAPRTAHSTSEPWERVSAVPASGLQMRRRDRVSSESAMLAWTTRLRVLQALAAFVPIAFPLLLLASPAGALSVVYRYTLEVTQINHSRGPVADFLAVGDLVTGSFVVDLAAVPYETLDPAAVIYREAAGATVEAAGLLFEPAPPGSDFSLTVADNLGDPSALLWLEGAGPVDVFGFSINDDLVAPGTGLRADVGVRLIARGVDPGLVVGLGPDALVPDLALATETNAYIYFGDGNEGVFAGYGVVVGISKVPEPSTALLLGPGLAALALRRRLSA